MSSSPFNYIRPIVHRQHSSLQWCRRRRTSTAGLKSAVRPSRVSSQCPSRSIFPRSAAPETQLESAADSFPPASPLPATQVHASSARPDTDWPSPALPLCGISIPAKPPRRTTEAALRLLALECPPLFIKAAARFKEQSIVNSKLEQLLRRGLDGSQGSLGDGDLGDGVLEGGWTLVDGGRVLQRSWAFRRFQDSWVSPFVFFACLL